MGLEPQWIHCFRLEWKIFLPRPTSVSTSLSSWSCGAWEHNRRSWDGLGRSKLSNTLSSTSAQPTAPRSIVVSRWSSLLASRRERRRFRCSLGSRLRTARGSGGWVVPNPRGDLDHPGSVNPLGALQPRVCKADPANHWRPKPAIERH